MLLSYCAMKLSEFMREKLQGYGTQAKFARKAKISTATASKWAAGEFDRAPNFENCLRIAAYFSVSPLHVFEMADRPDFSELFLELFPEYQPKPLPETVSACCENHIEECKLLHVILKGPKWWADGIRANLEAMHSKSSGGPVTEGDQGPGPDDSLVNRTGNPLRGPGNKHRANRNDRKRSV